MRLELEQAYTAATETEKIRRSILAVAPHVVRDAMAENNQLTLVDLGNTRIHQTTSLEMIPQAS